MRFAVEDANSPERPSVGPTNRISQIGYHVEPYVRIVFPDLIQERVGDQQLVILGNHRFTVEARARKVLRFSAMIRISLRGARDKNVDVLTQDPHDQTSGHIEQLRHQIHNLLPLSQNRVWNRWFWMMIWRNLVPAGSYFFHRGFILCGLRERISRKDAKTQRQPRIYANQNGEKHEPHVDQPSSGSRRTMAGSLQIFASRGGKHYKREEEREFVSAGH